MTYFITALSNDSARLIVKEARVSCAETANLIATTWENAGYIVIRQTES